MTLILTLGNPEQVIQISDRRLSCNGRLADDESNKAGILTCPYARMAFGFTGLARLGNFVTRDWLLEALFKCGPPDYSIGGILDRLKARADKTFAEHPVLQVAAKRDKCLSILFSGYLHSDNPPLLGFAILTNYQDFQTGCDEPEAWDEFEVTRWTEQRPLDHAPTLVQRVGNWHAMNDNDEIQLRRLLMAGKPAKAVVGKAIELMREMADRPAAQGTIGKQLSTIRIPSNLNEAAESDYYSSSNEFVTYVADGVVLIPGGKSAAWKDIEVEAVGPGRAIRVAKVGRNQPCPCGSGKKYKYCHGR